LESAGVNGRRSIRDCEPLVNFSRTPAQGIANGVTLGNKRNAVCGVTVATELLPQSAQPIAQPLTTLAAE